ncbi:unnamed protein product [Prorocentrum cordatum]|uniref:Hemimethylated DNA-binding domain-containing protein n=1 Tax=Prorocentrum cordatum TaxID=2364126 RepID=A0ABN9PKF0_9DINO|nr:unnamed protein product [Polarella glacialis]
MSGPGLGQLARTLQGQWGDDVGLRIHVSGLEASFSDAPEEVFPLLERSGGLVLRGGRLGGTALLPAWRFPNGARRRWARWVPDGVGDLRWLEAFESYKAQRSRVWERIAAATAAFRFEERGSLLAAWRDGDADLLGTVPGELAERLLRGRWLVPGACAVHAAHGHRVVVLSCEPWCPAPAAWRARHGAAELPRGEAQPFCLCLVDERDQPGGRVALVAEERLGPTDTAFPLAGHFVERLFARCDLLGGYLPTDRLDRALERLRLRAWSFGA